MEEHHADDQSHYEISLTAGQAFVAFVLLLLSLAASFAFGLMLGKGQADERLVVRKEGPVVTEAGLTPKKSQGKIVELGVDDDDFSESEAAPPKAAPTETMAPAVIEEDAPVESAGAAPALDAPKPAADPVAPSSQPPAKLSVVHYAQLLSTADQKVAESLAARLIDRGFTAAYVERGTTDKGAIFRVRVRFDNENQARSAEPRLREFSKEVWITSR